MHTGDLLNFPSPKAAEWAAETMERHGLPFLFIVRRTPIGRIVQN